MAIVLDHVNHIYEEGTSISFQALTDINLVIPDGQFIGLIGHTGSGKSTLVQHLNGLLPRLREPFITMVRILMKRDIPERHCAARSDWYFSIRSTSFLKPMCLQMSVLDQRTWDLTGKRWN